MLSEIVKNPWKMNESAREKERARERERERGITTKKVEKKNEKKFEWKHLRKREIIALYGWWAGIEFNASKFAPSANEPQTMERKFKRNSSSLLALRKSVNSYKCFFNKILVRFNTIWRSFRHTNLFSFFVPVSLTHLFDSYWKWIPRNWCQVLSNTRFYIHFTFGGAAFTPFHE